MVFFMTFSNAILYAHPLTNLNPFIPQIAFLCFCVSYITLINCVPVRQTDICPIPCHLPHPLVCYLRINSPLLLLCPMYCESRFHYERKHTVSSPCCFSSFVMIITSSFPFPAKDIILFIYIHARMCV